MESLIPVTYPIINHPDFAPTRGEFLRPPFPAPPPDVLNSLVGSPPYEPVDLETLNVRNDVAILGFIDLPNWTTGRIIRKKHMNDILQFVIQIHGGRQTIISIWKDGYYTWPDVWFYRITGPITPDESKGLSEISAKYKLPYEIVGSIKEGITGTKPTRFRPDSKTGGRTRKAKNRKRTRRSHTRRRR